jgi:hypothetical protein
MKETKKMTWQMSAFDLPRNDGCPRNEFLRPPVSSVVGVDNENGESAVEDRWDDCRPCALKAVKGFV